MSKIKLLIVEDELLVADNLATNLKNSGYEVCEIADNSSDALQLFENENPDLVLMDINIRGKIDGIGVATTIKKLRSVPIIFLTAQGDSMTVNRAKEVNPSAYIIKPFNIRDLTIAIEIALHNFSNTHPSISPSDIPESFPADSFYIFDERIFVKTSPGRFVEILLDDILWIEAVGNYSTIITEKQKYMVSIQISYLAEKLSSPLFMKVHRSYVINMKKVDLIEETTIFISGTAVPLSKNNKAEFMKHFKVI